MPYPLRHGGQCVYCAFRAHRLALQSLRLRQRSTKRLFHSTSSTSAETKIRNIWASARPGEFNAKLARMHPIDGSDGVVRKFLERARDGDKPRWTMGKPGLFKNENFEQQVGIRLEFVKEELRKAPLVEELRKEKIEAGEKADSFDKIWKDFTSKLNQESSVSLPFLGNTADREQDSWTKSLRDAYAARGVNGLDDRLKYTFYAFLINPRFTSSDITNQRTLADLRYPSEWYPATRREPRTVHLHIGPTNSGKTYHALQRLEQAESGVYAGPLRLLAHEVYTRLNAKGKPCSLVTGEERRMADVEANDFGATSACTVEMMPLNRVVDVAVIDEIQMIGNAERGWAWTQAFLGARAKEIHLCGEERTVPLVREICASLGEKLHIHQYKRLSPLEMEGDSLNGKLNSLRKGDCIVSFSVMGIHALRRQIERETGKKVATVYGSLPPETRAQQARLFNDPDNEYDFLVASDAVGMGLNLAIKRIIFEASNKFDGSTRRTLSVADIKQIAGRAGRYRIATEQAAHDQKDDEEQKQANEDLAAAKGEDASLATVENITTEQPTPQPPSASESKEETKGLVTTLEKFDYPIVRAAMSASPEPIRTAGLFPPAPILERFASYFPPYTPFSYILTRLHELSQMHPRFHLCGLKDQVWIADQIERVNGLTVTDRNIICSCPASTGDKDLWVNLMPAYARCIAEQTGGAIYDIEELPLEILEADVSASRQYLRGLEQLHKGIVAYLWLSYRFAGVFYTRSLAFHVKSLVEDKIEEVLSKFSFTEANRRRLAAQREKQLLEEMEAVAGQGREGQSGVDSVVEEAEGDEDVDDGPQKRHELELRGQTTLTSGGDHFGGEEDIGFQEPMEDENAESSHRPPLETQDVPPEPREPHVPEQETTTRPGQNPAGHKQFSAGVPPKHLAQLDIDAKPAERDWASRP